MLTNQLDDGTMAVSCRQVQRDVVSAIRSVYANSTLDQHLDQFHVAFFARPMQRAESVIVAETNIKKHECFSIHKIDQSIFCFCWIFI